MTELDEVKSENASLRGAAQGLGELCDKYKAENAKLRELAAELYPYAKAYTQLGLTLGRNDSKSYEWFIQLRKLGIEVS